MARTMSTALKCFAAAAAVALVAGCADGDGSGYGDPGAAPLAAGQSCGSIRADLDRLDKKGTQSKVEAASQGKKLPPASQADVDRYNYFFSTNTWARVVT